RASSSWRGAGSPPGSTCPASRRSLPADPATPAGRISSQPAMSWSIPASLVTAVSLAVAMPSAPASDAAIVRDAQTLLERVAPADGPGVAMLIARGDRVLFRGARGRANVELGVPLSPDHVFRIASVTKTFTAALVLRLVDDGKLSLDDRVSAYVP